MPIDPNNPGQNPDPNEEQPKAEPVSEQDQSIIVNPVQSDVSQEISELFGSIDTSQTITQASEPNDESTSSVEDSKTETHSQLSEEKGISVPFKEEPVIEIDLRNPRPPKKKENPTPEDYVYNSQTGQFEPASSDTSGATESPHSSPNTSGQGPQVTPNAQHGSQSPHASPQSAPNAGSNAHHGPTQGPQAGPHTPSTGPNAPGSHPQAGPNAPHGQQGAPQAHPHAHGPRVELKPEEHGLGIVREYRELREKGSIVTMVDNTARFGAAGAATFVAGESSKWLFANTISSFLPFRFGWVPGMGALVAGGTFATRAVLDYRRYENLVKQKFEEAARNASLQGEVPEQTIKEIRKEMSKNRGKHSNQLLDNEVDGDDASFSEQEIITALHDSGIAKPALVPYLLTEAEYAEYCFVQLRELCKAAADGKNIAGLNHHQTEALKKYHLETAHNKEKVRKSLVEMCSVYGRLLSEYHRDKREAQVYGGVIGAMTSMFTLSGGYSVLWGGLTLAGRKLWVAKQKTRLHIEINSEGKLVDKQTGSEHLVPPRLSRGEHTLFDHHVFPAMAEMKKEALPDRAKAEYDRIVIPHNIHETHFDTPENMAKAASPGVVANLMNLKALPRPGTAFDIEQAQEKLKAETQTLRDLEKEFRELPEKIEDTKAAFQEADAAKGTGTAEERANGAKAITLSDKLKKLQKRLEKFEPPTGIPGLIEQQRERQKDAEKTYKEVKEGKIPDKTMTIEEIVNDEDIKKAFAVKIHATFSHQKPKGQTVLGRFGHYLKDKAMDKLKELGDAASTGALVGTVGAAGAGIAAATLTSLNPVAVAAVTGIPLAIVIFLLKIKSGTIKIETKKDDHGGHH